MASRGGWNSKELGLDWALGGHQEGPLPGDSQPVFTVQAGSHLPWDMHVLPGKVRGVFVPHTFFFKNFRPRANCPSWFPHSAACMQKQSKEQKPRHAPLPCEKAACVHHCLFLAALGLHCTLAFSSCSGQGASHCGGFSCCAALALGMQASVAVVHRLSCGLSCLRYVSSSQTRDQTCVPCTGRQILNP